MDRPVLRLATANPGKVAELRQLLGHRYRIEPRPDDLAETVEDGDTLLANSLKKAREVVRHAGQLAVADDSGLFVDALDGRPGVRSARFAGQHATDDENNELLLAELGRVDEPARTASFRTVVAVVWPDGREVTVDGVTAGRIIRERRGTNGFGYDPLFVPDEGDGSTYAEMPPEAKHDISHRGRAVAALLRLLDAEVDTDAVTPLGSFGGDGGDPGQAVP